MADGVQVTESVAGPVRRGIAGRIDARLRSLRLLDRSALVRRMVDLSTKGVAVDPIPAWLGESNRAVLVSNYPSVSQTLRALIKMGCQLPGDRFRVKGIGRPDVVANAGAALRALGIDHLIFPVYKDDAGAYKLHKQVVKQVLEYLKGEGNLLWMSITGTTRGNGLLETDVRTGAALFSVGEGVPMVPMGLVTRLVKGKPRVVKVRFGEAISPPPVEQLSDFDKTDLLVDLSRLALCSAAGLLPPGQRGDFEQVEEKLQEIEARLGARYG
jgi:hypothetical protein